MAPSISAASMRLSSVLSSWARTRVVVYPANRNQVRVTEGNAVAVSNSQLCCKLSSPISFRNEFTAPYWALYRFRKIMAMADWEIIFGIM